MSGVYLFKGARNKVIYVGKAANLRSRVRQYLRGGDGRFMVPFLVSEALDVDVVITHTAKEALLLENSLIKKHRPRYNVKLVDDKNFLHLRLDRREAWPRFTLVRQLRDDGPLYFGPYHSASKARDTLAMLQRAFPIRTCTDAVLRSRKRPCLLHQMGRCVAPCVDLATAEAYNELLDEAVMLLQGKRRPLVQRLKARMVRHAEAEEFEQAAQVRDVIRSIEHTLERQSVVDPKLGDRDMWGIARSEGRAAVVILPVREGFMGEPRVTLVDRLGEDLGESLSTLVNTAYPAGVFIPKEICLPEDPVDVQALVEVLTERRGKRVVVWTPKKGDKRRLIELAVENGRLRLAQANDEDARLQRSLEELAKICGLSAPPHRIECFDNSNIGGEFPVAAMAVFIDGRPARAEYRRYKVKTIVGSDDYGTMREILGRRFRRAIEDGVFPDLLVVDGGKGQLNVALAVLQDLGLHNQAVIGISKPRTERRHGDRHATDKIVLPNVKDPIRPSRAHGGLRVLQYIRDEVHNHAIRYHRQVRRRTSLTSVLESIVGVGPARRKALLTKLGSAAAVVDASREQLAQVDGIGPALADQIYKALHPE